VCAPARVQYVNYFQLPRKASRDRTIVTILYREGSVRFVGKILRDHAGCGTRTQTHWLAIMLAQAVYSPRSRCRSPRFAYCFRHFDLGSYYDRPTDRLYLVLSPGAVGQLRKQLSSSRSRGSLHPPPQATISAPRHQNTKGVSIGSSSSLEYYIYMRLFFRSAAVPHKQGVALPLHRRARKPRVSAMLSGFRSGGAAYVYTLLLLVCRDGLPASGC